MFKLVLFYLVAVVVHRARGPFPHNLYRESWANGRATAHIIKMSEHLCKDAYLKLRMAEKVAEIYKRTYAFELGLLTAGIYDRFHHMTKIYRFYVNLKDFENHKHTLEQMMGGYSAMQSDYSQMRAETDLYQEVEAAQIAQEQKENVLAQFLAKKYGTSAATMKRLVAQGMFSEYQAERSGRADIKDEEKVDPIKEYLRAGKPDKHANTGTFPKWSMNADNEDAVEKLMRINAGGRRSLNTDSKDNMENILNSMEMDDIPAARRSFDVDIEEKMEKILDPMEMHVYPGARKTLNMAIEDRIPELIEPIKANFNPASRRSINTKNEDEEEFANILENLKKPKRGKVLWNLKNNTNTNNDNEFKKQMRYIKWAEKWKGFNPETEGVHIPDWIARMGLANESQFLQKELKLV